jgi:hypothetical protein
MGEVIKIPVHGQGGVKFALVDKEFGHLLKYRWHLSDKGYAMARIVPGRGQKLHKMHRLISEKPNPGHTIDHINRDKLDNRSCNLRIITFRENSYNSALSRKNTSGYKGVGFMKTKQKWRAYSRGDNYKHIHLGLFDTPEKAAIAYNNYVKDEIGECAYLNEIPRALI